MNIQLATEIQEPLTRVSQQVYLREDSGVAQQLSGGETGGLQKVGEGIVTWSKDSGHHGGV